MLRSLAITESSREGKGSRGTGEGPEGQERCPRRGARQCQGHHWSPSVPSCGSGSVPVTQKVSAQLAIIPQMIICGNFLCLGAVFAG